MADSTGTYTNSMLVSIIIPLYNGEKHILRCLNSVVSQTYSNIELVVVDDGSTDQSFEICSKRLANMPNVILLRQKNSGPSIARKNGFNASHGDYVMFIDSDDSMESNCVECALQNAIRLDCDILQYSISSYNPFHYKRVSPDKTYEGVEYYIKFRKHGDFLWDKIYKRNIIALMDFPEIYHSEDAYMMIQLMYYAKRIGRINDVLYHHIANDEGLSLSDKYIIRKIEQTKAGLLMTDFSKDKSQILYKYSRVYSCIYSANNYLGIRKVNGHKNEKDFLIKAFLDHYSLSDALCMFFHNTVSFKRFLLLILFRFLIIPLRKTA